MAPLRSRSLRVTLLCGLASLATACGTTVPITSQQQLSGSARTDGLTSGGLTPDGLTSQGGAVEGPTGSSGQPGSVAGPGSAVTGSAGRGQVTAGGAAGTPGAPGTAAGPAKATLPKTGRGYDEKFAYLGVLTVKDLQAVAGGLGLEIDPGDGEGQANAVAAHVNRNGGVLGRQLKIVFRDHATTEVATDPDRVGAETCTDFTQDRKVFAVYNPITTLDTANLRACFAKAGVPIFSASSAITDTEALRGIEGLFFQTAMVAWDKLAPVLVSRLKAQGWFGGWDVRLGRPGSAAPKVGILTSTTKAGTRVAAQIKGALAAAGHPGAVVYQWTDASKGQNASVQHFSGNGVTHVIVADLELTAFQNSAQSQQYKPRYGISSYNDPYTNLETLSPQGANNGALGIGWAPAYDVSDANDPGSTGPGAKTCVDLMAKGGQSFSGKRTARLFAMTACDSILLAIEGARVTGGLDAASLYRGALQVSPTFSTAVSFGTSALAPDHLFTPSSARDLAWFTDCECFTYTSKTATGRF